MKRYRIGEAARILGLESYVLRFWESEFSQLRPLRTPKGQRLYSEHDLSLLRNIQNLLHNQGMTIEGARRVLGDPCPPTIPEQTSSEQQLRRCLQETVAELVALRALLRNG